jgi:hypothetical protein
MEDQKYLQRPLDAPQCANSDKTDIPQKFETAPGSPRRHSFWHKTGFYVLSVLTLGTVGLLLALSLITFLWKGVDATVTHDGSKVASFWCTIMITAWLSRTVTLSSLVIRLAVASQAGIRTSMLAALLLEGSGIPIPWLAEASLMRSSTTGPHQLATAVLQALPRIHEPTVIPTLYTLVLTTILSQFCSTALLSDLKPGMIITNTHTSAIPYGVKPNYNSKLLPFQGNDYWATKPPSYPAFAEYAESPEHTNESFYTGKVYRAMPPFSDTSERSTVHNYSGNCSSSPELLYPTYYACKGVGRMGTASPRRDRFRVALSSSSQGKSLFQSY